MSRDVLTIGSTMRIPLSYIGEYSQWVERFMNYLEEQTDGEAMINSIKNGDQPLPRVTQVSISGTSSNEQPPLKDNSMWSDQQKKIQKINHLARSLLIQGLPNDIYSLIDSNKTAKDLWEALARHMLGSEYGEQDRKAAVLYEYETFKANEGELLLDTYIRYLQVINDLKKCGYSKIINKNLMDIYIDALYNILKQNQGDVNDDMGLKKKNVVVTSDPLALIAEKTKVSKSKEKIVVSLDSKGSDTDDFSELKKITALLAKACNRKKFYSKPTNNLRTSSTSQSANKKQEFVKSDNKKVEKKDDEKKRDMSKVKCYNCKKEGHFSKDCKKSKLGWSPEINANMVFMAQIKKVLSDSETSSSSADEKISEVAYYTSDSESEFEFETSEYYDKSTNYGLFMNNDDDQEIFHDAIESASENFIENHNDSKKDYDKYQVDYNDSEEKEHLVDKLIRKFNKKIVKRHKRIEKANKQRKDFENQNKDLQDKYDVLKNQATTFEMNNKELNEQLKVLIEKNDDLLAQTKVLKDQIQVKHVVIDTHVECQEKYAKHEAERYEYMIRYSAYFDNDKQHRKQIADQEVMYDKMSVQLVELDKHKKWSSNTSNVDLYSVSILKLNKDVKRYSRKDLLSCNNSHPGETSSAYVCNDAMNDSWYTPMFLTHSDEALEIKKFKRSRENKIELASDYGNLNASYVNEKINFKDDYFQEIINPDFEKIDSPFQQTSLLKPYVPNVILEKIIIDLEDEVVNLLEKEKVNLETIESLKSKGFESVKRLVLNRKIKVKMIVLLLKKSVTKRRIQR
nr:integrase, catalytic region, zinc finger, CCHC-type, peptidase aspartic, catalytic [Tanacetum cinerariifolium]